MPQVYSRPHFAISSLSSPLLSFDDLSKIADDWRFDGIDLDLTHWWRRQRFSELVPLEDRRRHSIHSLWVTLSSLETHGGAFAVKPWLKRLLSESQEMTIVIADPGDALGDQLRNRRFQHASILKSVVGDRHRVALGVRASTRAGGRSHLMRLRALRSLSEEWELGLALDLSDADDWQWEAEAAIFHAVPNLDLIRLALPGSTFDAHVRSRLTTRTIAAAVDSGFCGIFALAPHLAFWQWRNRDLMEAHCSEGREKIVTVMRGERDAIIRDDAPTWTRQ